MHHILMLIVECIAFLLIFAGAAPTMYGHRDMDRVDKALIFDSFAFGEAMSRTAIGVVLIILGALGVLVWVILS